MNNVITATVPASKEPDYAQLRQKLVNSMGVDAYLESFSRYLKSQPITDAERFEVYYRTRCEIKTNNE